MINRAKSLSTAGKFLWPIPDKGLRKRIHRIAAPTLLIWGGSDKIVPPSYGGLFQDRIAGSRLVTIPRRRPLPHAGAAGSLRRGAAGVLGDDNE